MIVLRAMGMAPVARIQGEISEVRKKSTESIRSRTEFVTFPKPSFVYNLPYFRMPVYWMRGINAVVTEMKDERTNGKDFDFVSYNLKKNQSGIRIAGWLLLPHLKVTQL